MNEKRIYFSREEMFKLNKDRLEERGVKIEDIAQIAFSQQSKYNPDIKIEDCIQSVEKILSYRDIFHLVQLSIEIDRLTEMNAFRSPIQEIMMADLGMFGIDEIFGLSIAQMYGTIGQTNFGDIDVNKPGIVKYNSSPIFPLYSKASLICVFVIAPPPSRSAMVLATRNILW